MRWRREDPRTGGWPSWAADVGSILVAIVVGGLAADAGDGSGYGPTQVDALLGLVAVVVLWWRRRTPLVVTAIGFVAAAVTPLAAGAAIVGVYTVASQRPTRTAVVVAALYLAPGGVAVLLRGEGTEDLGEGLFGAVLFTVGALGWGLAVRARRLAAEERAAHREREQHVRLTEARQHERRRIATEMHDVLAHRLSLLSLHAGAIEHRPEMHPDDLAASARLVRRNAHLALDDLRDVIGVLRDDDASGLDPAPTASDLDALLEESRQAGMWIEGRTTSVDLDALPSELGRHTYRIVQEGLTNARKHAPGRPVVLRLTGEPGQELQVEIANATGDDPVAPDGPVGREGPAGVGTGVGLVGLEERVASVGGTLRHGVDEAGVHRLRARLPWPS